MQLKKRDALTIVIYWYALAFLSGWIARGSSFVEILGLIILDGVGFIVTIILYKPKSPKTEKSEKE